MKVIKKGRPQAGWSKEFSCTGNGNGGGGCGAKLLVSVGDLYHTYSSAMGERDRHTTFTCPECGVETDISDVTYPGSLPDKPVWFRQQRVQVIEARVTVDAVITLGGSEIVLIKRAKEPFQDKLVLPGGHVEEGEDPIAACIREIEEEVGLRVAAGQLKFLTVLDQPGRDPRPGRRTSLVYHIPLPMEAREELRAGSDAREIVVQSLATLASAEVGFDHWKAIELVRRHRA